MCVCVPVTSRNTLFRRSWRPLVKGCIAYNGLQWHNVNFFPFWWFLAFFNFFGFWTPPKKYYFDPCKQKIVFLPSKLLFHSSFFFFFFLLWTLPKRLVHPPEKTKKKSLKKGWYWCYYPHQSRDSVSPVCGFSLYKKDNAKKHPLFLLIM